MRRLKSKETMAIERPPQGTHWPLALLKKEDREILRGDLDEEYRTRLLARLGPRRARRWYWGQALRSLGWRRMSLAWGNWNLSEKRKGDGMGQALLQDLRYGARLLLRNPTFTVVAVLTLALGIGANTAIFSVVNGVVLQPPPYPEVDRVVRVYNTYEGRFTRGVLSPGMYFDWKEVDGIFDAFSITSNKRLIFTEGGEPESIWGMSVSPDLFAALGVFPAQGRVFAPEETTPGQDKVIILSHRLWQRRFGGNDDVLGQPITLEGDSYTVVGVMSAGFRYPQDPQFWLPMVETAGFRNRRNFYYLTSIGRLKEGVTPEQASQALTRRLRSLKEEFREYENRGADVVPIHESQIQRVKSNLWMLLGAVGFVLLIACANVANLLLARAASREKEMALRRAVGAGRMRLVRQLLTESILLATTGAGLGALLAWGGVRAFIIFSPPYFPRLDEMSLDLTVFLYVVGITMATGILFGLAPALHSTRLNLVESLKEGGRGSESAGGSVRHSWLRQSLVTVEVALALVLLVGAGLLTKSFAVMMAEDPGFQTENLLMAQISLPTYKYPEGALQLHFFNLVLERLRAQPQVQNAAAVNALPFSTWVFEFGFGLPDVRGEDGGPKLGSARFGSVTPGYFQTVQIPLLGGRVLTEQDDAQAPHVAVISESFAQENFEKEQAIGKTITFANNNWTIVGVVGDVRHDNLTQRPRPTFYVPFAQRPASSMMLVARTTGSTTALARSIRNTVQTIDPDQPVQSVNTVEDLISRLVATPRFYMLLLTLFAAIASTLAAVGIYGVMAYSVHQRTHEIGVRMALGAQHGDVLRLVLSRGLMLTGLGVALGLGGAYGLTRYLQSLLYEVETTDPLIFAGISLLLLAVSLLACYLPARRAALVEPMVALRYE